MKVAGGREGSKYNGEPEIGEKKHSDIAAILDDPTISFWRKCRAWHDHMSDYMRKWAEKHRNGEPDTWTPGAASPVERTESHA